jgi:uncharacterized phage protein gp47/JayE
VTLQGLDANYNNPEATGYTVQDASGNKFILATSETFTAGTYSRDFRAQTIGVVSVPINTITTPVTVVNGVISVNNPTAATSVGQTQETDAQLRVRRQQSVSNASTGYLNGLLGKILSLEGVTEAVLYENVTNATDAFGIPEHCIWLIVAGGADIDIANTLYGSKSYGCDMRGSETYNITTASGGTFVAKWDNPTPETLYIRFDIKRTVPTFVFSEATIKTYIKENLNYGIGQFAETSSITAIALLGIISQGGGGVPINVEISRNNSTWFDYLETTTLASEWTVDSANITITVV